jgi:hypothetical protein
MMHEIILYNAWTNMYKIKAYEQMRMKINNNIKPNNKTWWSDKNKA